MKYTILMFRPNLGVNLLGVFDNYSDAYTYAEKNCSGDWWIVEIPKQ